MKQMFIDGDPQFLPHEIITNILKRLPVKSLIRFQCVCKHWKNLIKTPSFISDHLHFSNLQNPSLLFERDPRDRLSSLGRPLNLFSLDCEMQVREVQGTPLIDRLSRASIIGSSNGLLCVEIHPYVLDWSECSPPSIVLWNPATRELRNVPIIRSSSSGYGSKWISGFGFSTVVNDYKIVRFFVSNDLRIRQGEVYSLSTGSWKQIDIDLEVMLHSCFETVCIDGVIFWHGSKAGWARDILEIQFNIIVNNRNTSLVEESDFVLSFDIATEVFTWMPWPALDHSRPKFTSYLNKLTGYNNKLALLSHTKVGDFLTPSSLIDLWVMEEGTSSSVERWSWTKIHTIVTSLDVYLYPFSIWRNDVVCEVHEDPTELGVDGRLVILLSLLNPDADEVKKITIPRHHHRISAVFNHVESLVSVGNIHIEEPLPSS